MIVSPVSEIERYTMDRAVCSVWAAGNHAHALGFLRGMQVLAWHISVNALLYEELEVLADIIEEHMYG